MKKLTNGILWLIGVVGAGLVSEGIISGEELTAAQNITGIVLAGGSLSMGMVISIISSIPIQLVNAGYSKAVDKYGVEKVDGVLNTFDDLLTTVKSLTDENQEIKSLLNTLNDKLDKAEQTRQKYLNE